MARWARRNEPGPTAGARVLGCLQTMWLGYQDGELPIAPDEMDPRGPCDLVRVIPELVVWDEFGWTIYLHGEIVRYDWSWEEPYKLMSYALWAEYQDVLDELRESGG